MREHGRSILGRWLATAGVWLLGAAWAMPMLWMAAVSLRGDGGTSSGGGSAGLVERAALNYGSVWNSPLADFPLYLKNTAWVTVLSVMGVTVSSAVAAYGFSRVTWRGRDGLFVVVVATLALPQAVLLAPQYVIFKELGLIGTLMPLWVPSWFGSGFGVFLLRQFFRTIPRELDEAAMMDGCSRWGVFWRVIVPLSRPALAVVALTQFVSSWNDFLGPMLFLNHQEQYTLSLGLQMYQSQHGGVPWNLVMAASVLTVLPVVVIYVLASRQFVEGASASGIKG